MMRFYLALFIAKIASFCYKLIYRRRSTTGPAILAKKICPNFEFLIKKPKYIIAIMGTNGKTTLNNLINDALKSTNIKIMCNTEGANLTEGIITTIIDNTNFLGNVNTDVAIFEVDERYSPKCFQFLKPNIVVLTNILKDSIQRNPNPQYISYILKYSIPKSSQVIVNYENNFAVEAMSKHNCKYYMVEKNDDVKKNIDAENMYKGLLIENNDGANSNILKIQLGDSNYILNNLPEARFNISNKLAAIVAIYEFLKIYKDQKIDFQNIVDNLNKVKLNKTRHIEFITKNNKKIINITTKGLNPGAGNTVIDFVSKDNTKKQQLVLMMANDKAKKTIEWLYDIEFEKLNKSEIINIVIAGNIRDDVYLRLIYAGIDKEKIHIINNDEDMQKYIICDSKNEFEKTYILRDMNIDDFSMKYSKYILEN